MKIIVVGGTKILEEKILLSKNIHVKYVTCGRSNCSCRLGKKHGPYYYIRRKKDGRYSDEYVDISSRQNHNFKYEIVNHDIIMEISDTSEIPIVFATCPTFMVTEKIR